MNRLTSGSVALLALLLVAGCKDDPTEALRGGIDHLVSNPSQLFLQLGESKTVEVGAVDEQGNPLDFEYLVTATGNGITVTRDSTYLPIFVDDSTLAAPPTGARFRFLVTATGYAATSFTVSAGGLDVDVPVQVVPSQKLAAAISNLTPALGEVVTITAPAGTLFSSTSTVTFTGPLQPADIVVAADGSTISFVPPPGLSNAAATITDVSAAATPGVLFEPETVDGISTPSVATFTGVYSTTTPLVNDPVTLTLTGATFDPAVTLTLGGGAPTVLTNTGTAITFLPDPGATGLLVVHGVILDPLPQFSLTLTGTDSIFVDVVLPAPLAGTDDPTTAPAIAVPAAGERTSFFDVGTFTGADITADGGLAAQYYQFTVTEAGDYTFTTQWSNGADVDGIICSDVTCSDGGIPAGDLVSQPEVGTLTLTPGTYYYVVVLFDGDIPAWVNPTIAH